MRILIAGCGYLGSELVRVANASGLSAVPLRRTAGEIHGTPVLALDLSTDFSLDMPFTHVVYAVSPKHRDETVYEQAFRAWQLRLLTQVQTVARWIMVSSTAVYDASEALIDENGKRATGGTPGVLARAEDAMQKACGACGCEFISARLSGIYGTERRSLLTAVAHESEAYVSGPNEDGYGNRIHVNDGARALDHLLRIDRPSDCYNVSDQTPARMSEVRAWMREQLSSRPRLAEGLAQESARNRAPGTQKRIDSSRLVESGFVFRFPSYREGYASIIDELETKYC